MLDEAMLDGLRRHGQRDDARSGGSVQINDVFR